MNVETRKRKAERAGDTNQTSRKKVASGNGIKPQAAPRNKAGPNPSGTGNGIEKTAGNAAEIEPGQSALQPLVIGETEAKNGIAEGITPGNGSNPTVSAIENGTQTLTRKVANTGKKRSAKAPITKGTDAKGFVPNVSVPRGLPSNGAPEPNRLDSGTAKNAIVKAVDSHVAAWGHKRAGHRRSSLQ
jgi:hypothetical protein